MSDDEQAIRDLVTTWLEAGAAGDLPRLRSLLAEDVVFLTPGQAPMIGRDAFVAAFRTGLQQYHIDAKTEIQEIQVIEDMAYYWSHLAVTVTPVIGGTPQQRAGYTLTVLRKTDDGKWVVSRDATCWRTDQP